MDFNIQIPHPALQSYIQHYVFVEVGINNS